MNPTAHTVSHIHIINNLKKLKLWPRASKGVTPVNYTSETDWQMAERRNNVISITIYRMSILILPSLLRVCFTAVLLSLDLRIKILKALVSSPTMATCHAHLQSSK